MEFLIRPTSLFFKVILVTSLILILAVSFIVWWDLSLYEASIEKMAKDKTEIISEFIEKNVIRAMERGRHYDIHRTLQNFAIYQGVKKINLFTPDGVIRASTDGNELKKNVGDVNFYLQNRSVIRKERFPSNTGENGSERIYYFNNPIVNHPSCFNCHDRKEELLGILSVAHSLKENDMMVKKVKFHSVIVALITVGFLSFILTFLFMRFVEHPIKKITRVMAEVEQGDFDARVDLKSRDEMGNLARDLNAMIVKLKQAKEETEVCNQALVQRADRMATIGELASGIAHEIRNPLAGIHGAIQIIGKDFPEIDDRRRITEEIQKQIHKLERLVKDLLNYAKPVPPKYLLTDMNELVHKVISFFASQQSKLEGIKVEMKLTDFLPKLMVDPNAVEQVFLNILLNAQKAMPKGGTLTVSTLYKDLGQKGAGRVQVVFEDTGVGISKENLSKIFDPFFSTRSDGTGLGLSITKNIVEQHNGTIEVESQVKVGTKVTITLPVTKTT